MGGKDAENKFRKRGEWRWRSYVQTLKKGGLLCLSSLVQRKIASSYNRRRWFELMMSDSDRAMFTRSASLVRVIEYPYSDL